MASCGVGSSSSGDDPLIIVGGSRATADDVVTSVVLRKTAAVTSANLGKNIISMQSIVDNSGTRLSLQSSTLLSVTSGAATNTATVELDVGALNAAFSTENKAGGLTTAALVFSGLTARMDVSNDGGSLLVSNVGIGNGPLTLSVDSVEQVRLVMETFVFSIEGDTGIIALHDNFDFKLSSGLLNAFSAKATTGSAFAVLDNGPAQVSQGQKAISSNF